MSVPPPDQAYPQYRPAAAVPEWAPNHGQPGYRQPAYGPPAQPGYPGPGYPPPTYGAPAFAQPAYGAPGYGPQPYPPPGYAPYPPVPYGLPAFASYGQRVGSFLIDLGIPYGGLVVVLLVAIATANLGLIFAAYGLGALAMLAFVIWNSGYRQGTTGQSIGKKAVGIRLVGAATGAPVGFGLAVGRQFAHVLDGMPLYLGYLWPLWDEQCQTFADKVCSTLVVRSDA